MKTIALVLLCWQIHSVCKVLFSYYYYCFIYVQIIEHFVTKLTTNHRNVKDNIVKYVLLAKHNSNNTSVPVNTPQTRVSPSH